MAKQHAIELTAGETVAVTITLTRDGAGVSLTGATVTFWAIWAGEYQGRQFGSSQPTLQSATNVTVKIEGASCTADADQSTYPGKLTWTPTTVHTEIPGYYWYQVKVVYADATVQYFPREIGDAEYQMVIHPAIEDLS